MGLHIMENPAIRGRGASVLLDLLGGGARAEATEADTKKQARREGRALEACRQVPTTKYEVLGPQKQDLSPDEPENLHRFNFDGTRPAPLLDQYERETDSGGTACFRESDDDLRPIWKRRRHLTREEERTASGNTLVESHLALVRKICVKVASRHGLKLAGDLEERLFAAGCEALLSAVHGFDPDEGRFATWAWRRIERSVKSALTCDLIATPRPSRKTIQKAFPAPAPLEVLGGNRTYWVRREGADHLHGRNLNCAFESVEKALGTIARLDFAGRTVVLDVGGDIEIKKLRATWTGDGKLVLRHRHKPHVATSLSTPLRKDGPDNLYINDGTLGDTIADTAPTPEEAAIQAEDAAEGARLVARSLEILSPRERRIFQARRLNDPPATLRRLAGEFGISSARVGQIESAAVAKLAAHVVKIRDKFGHKRLIPKRIAEVSWLGGRQHVRNLEAGGRSREQAQSAAHDARVQAYRDRGYCDELAVSLAQRHDAAIDAAHGLAGSLDHYWRKPPAKIFGPFLARRQKTREREGCK